MARETGSNEFQLVRAIFIGTGGLIAVAIVWGIGAWLVSYLTQGKLVVTTTTPHSTISLTSLTGTSVSSQGHTKLSVTLSSGQYVATVTGESMTSSQVVTVKAHHTAAYQLNPISTTGIEPVMYSATSNFVAGNSQLLFLNDSSKLSRIDANNNITVLDQNDSFRTINWANASFGVGENNSGHLFAITNGVVAPLNFHNYDSDDQPLVSVSPTKQVYVAVGGNLYLGGPSGNFKKIFSSNGDATILNAGKSAVAFVVSPDRDNGNAASGPGAQFFSIVQDSGKSVQQTNTGTFDAAISPDDTYLAIGTAQGGEILNASLKQIAAIPHPNFSHPVWLNNNTLLYSVADQLWTYNVLAQKSQVLAATPLAAPITEIAVSDDQSYVYLGVSNPSEIETLERVPLKNQTISNVVYDLQEIMPDNPGTVSLSMINFAGSVPTVLVQPVPGDPASDALQVAELTLEQDGFNLSQLQLVISPSD